MSTSQQNKAKYARFCEEVLVRGDVRALEELVAADVLSHAPFADQAPGRDGFKAALWAFRAAFPDLCVSIHQLLAENDLVVGHFTVRGTHRGEFFGIAATGKTVTYDEMAIVRFADGKIAEHWSVADTYAMMQVLGAVNSLPCS